MNEFAPTSGGTSDLLPAHLLTVDQLALFLSVSRAWVRKGILERTIPYTKIGRNVRSLRNRSLRSCRRENVSSSTP
jgi:excisionase family DNA binding protein